MHDHIRFLIALGKRGDGMHIFLPPPCHALPPPIAQHHVSFALPPVFFPAGDCLSYPPPRFSKQQPLDDVSRREGGKGKGTLLLHLGQRKRGMRGECTYGKTSKTGEGGRRGWKLEMIPFPPEPTNPSSFFSPLMMTTFITTVPPFESGNWSKQKKW